MAIQGFPFTSVAGDRAYGAADFASFFDVVVAGSSGVIQGFLNALAVTSLGSYQTRIDTGGAVYGGYGFRNTTTITQTHDAVATGSKRYDLIVFTLDTVTTRQFAAGIVKGTASTGTPTVPTAGATDTVLARLYIDNTSGTPSFTILDLRTYQSVSGSASSILTKLLTVDTNNSGLNANTLQGTDLTGVILQAPLTITSGDALAQIKSNGRGCWGTIASGCTNTPEGTATTSYSYFYFGDGAKGIIFANKEFVGGALSYNIMGAASWSSWRTVLNDFVSDQRITTGGARTETVNALSVGQTALMNWSLANNTGAGINITVALPAGGTYQCNIQTAIGPTNSLGATGGVNATSGTIAGGTTFTIGIVTTGQSGNLGGFIKRIS